MSSPAGNVVLAFLFRWGAVNERQLRTACPAGQPGADSPRHSVHGRNSEDPATPPIVRFEPDAFRDDMAITGLALLAASGQMLVAATT